MVLYLRTNIVFGLFSDKAPYNAHQHVIFLFGHQAILYNDFALLSVHQYYGRGNC